MKVKNNIKNLRIVKKLSHFYEGLGRLQKGGSKCLWVILEDKETKEVWSGYLSQGDRKWLIDDRLELLKKRKSCEKCGQEIKNNGEKHESR